ncbi:MAG: tetratricopeptide repeat protein [Isosphaeraceae bacterium]
MTADDPGPGARPVRAVLAVVLLATAGAAALAWWVAGRPERHLAEAARQAAAGEWDEASAWLVLPESRPATRDRALLLRARIALELGRPAEAVAPLNAVDADGPQAAEAAYWKGRALRAVGNTPLAMLWFRTALEKRPDDPETLRWLAAAAYDQGDRTTLLRSLRRLTTVRPDDAPAWRTLALVTLEEPDGGELEFDLARRAYETSLKLDPAQPRVRLELAGVLIKQGRFDEAAAQLDRCKGFVPESDRAALLAEEAWERGDRAACREAVERGLASAPNHPGLLARRGMLEQAEGRPEEALAWLNRAVEADPFESRWVYARSTALRVLGRLDEARRDAERASRLKAAVVTLSDLNAEAAARPLDAEVHLRAGKACEELGKPALAASWYRSALACDPRSIPAREALVRVGDGAMQAGFKKSPILP